MNAAELRARNRHDVTLASGLSLTIELPDMLDCMIAVEMPMPVIKHIRELEKTRRAAESNGGPPLDEEDDDLSLEELGHIRRANREGICRAVKAIDGESLEVPLTVEDVAGFTDEERDELTDYIQRVKPVPKAGALT